MTQFGQLFKQHRTALGLSLREFCRRNGFDPGNISRLERGLLPPPQNTDILTSYAKSLKLAQGSHAWDTFFALAAVETGRVPPQILASQTIQEKLPKMFRSLQGQRRRYGPWTKATELEVWADTYDARFTLPQLVRRLIHATVETLVRIEFPAGEGVQRPGWDGIVETPIGNAYVPSGLSGWEVSVEKSPRQKAEAVFHNRVKNSRGLDTSQMAFILVTPRKWTTKETWCTEKNRLGIWKEVRAYDSANLEEWLETAPGVNAWLARLLGQPPEGITAIDEHWANLTALTYPSLKSAVFLASREEAINELQEWLAGPPSSLAFEARSPIEVVDFVAAYLSSRDEVEHDVLTTRTLIVRTREVWSALAATSDRLVLIPHPTLAVEAEMVAEAVRQGHHVLLCSHRFPSEHVTKHTLPRAYRYDLEKALITSGMNEEEASRLARESRGSLTVLKRRLSRFASTSLPAWSQPPESASLVPFLLAGGWDDACAADQAVIEKLAGCSYNHMLSVANRWLTAEDPPMMRVLTRWSLVSREDAWILLAPNITWQHLDTFEEITREVLGEEDPKYDLPPDERWQASLHHKLPKYSYQLRTGLAETLALLGAKSDTDAVPDSVSLARRAETILRSLLPADASWKRWASLSDDLPLLAEACPEVFLDAVESDLRCSEPQLLMLFTQEGEPLFTSSPHTGLLWALETLAWEPAWLTRVSLVLARLAQLDPGGRLANRPLESLRRIFLPWLPQTTASVEQRLRIVNEVTKRLPDVGGQLLLSLLPTPHDFSHPTHRPAWRDWALHWSRTVPDIEYRQQVETYADRLIDDMNTDVDRWEQLIEKFEHFPQSAQDRLLSRLKALPPSAFEMDARQRMTDTLRKKISRHRQYADAQWALSPQVVDALATIQAQLEPQDLVARYAWLFVIYPSLVDASKGWSWHEREQVVFQQRRQALQEILTTQGFSRVLDLVKAAEEPYSVGAVLGKARLLDDDAELLPTLLVSDHEKLAKCASGYLWGRFDEAGWDWVAQLPLAQWSIEQAGNFLLVLPFEPRTWELVNQRGTDVSRHYWSRVRDFCRDSTKENVEYAVTMLLAHHRPFQAVEVLGMALHNQCEVEASLLMTTLEAGLTSGSVMQLEEGVSLGYRIQQLFEQLQSDPRVDTRCLAALEWGYLGLLDGHGASPKALHGWLQRDAQCFVDLLRMIFRSENEAREQVQSPTEEQKRRAQNAYRLLTTWKTAPGTRHDGTVDDQELTQWVATARTLCKETGHLAKCDSNIGKVLAYAPSESDGSWPCIPVRDILEEIDSAELVQGFENGIFNKRGVVMKSPTEGGEQERTLAKQYASYGDACDIEWPRTAAALRRVARRYEDDARREDERVQERL